MPNKIYQIKDQFDINEHFMQYLSAAYGPMVLTFPPSQMRAIEQAFYAGWGQVLIAQRDYVSTLGDDAGVAQLEQWIKDVTDKFKSYSK